MPEAMTPRERLAAALSGRPTDRPPCVCPGGMMNMVTRDLAALAGVPLPAAHRDPAAMAALSRAVLESGCFENLGAPFCMTVEAEGMGSSVDLGDSSYEPRVTGYALGRVGDVGALRPLDLGSGRAAATLGAIEELARASAGEAPVVGNLTGPVSVATSLVEPSLFYRSLNKDPQAARALLAFVTEQSSAFARAMVEAGADVVAVADPAATGEIMGPRHFSEFAVPYLNDIVRAAREAGRERGGRPVGAIVHICGRTRPIYRALAGVDADALSFDSCVSLREARAALPGRAVMGNVSTYAIELGTPERVRALTRACIEAGTDVVAPACGLGMRSPLANVRAMLEEARAAWRG